MNGIIFQKQVSEYLQDLLNMLAFLATFVKVVNCSSERMLGHWKCRGI